MISVEADFVGPWVAEKTGGTYSPGSASVIGLEKDGELVAGVMFENYNGNSVQMHVASDGSKRWMTKEFLRAAFWYPFEQLKVKKIIGLVDSTNLPAQRFDEHLGFRRECTIADAGKVEDMIVYSMTREQCKYLRWKHG